MSYLLFSFAASFAARWSFLTLDLEGGSLAYGLVVAVGLFPLGELLQDLVFPELLVVVLEIVCDAVGDDL
jgi:hypothetical protein